MQALPNLWQLRRPCPSVADWQCSFVTLRDCGTGSEIRPLLVLAFALSGAGAAASADLRRARRLTSDVGDPIATNPPSKPRLPAARARATRSRRGGAECSRGGFARRSRVTTLVYYRTRCGAGGGGGSGRRRHTEALVSQVRVRPVLRLRRALYFTSTSGRLDGDRETGGASRRLPPSGACGASPSTRCVTQRLYANGGAIHQPSARGAAPRWY